MVTIAEYLLNRLKALDVSHIFGLPGDYNLTLLDAIEADKDMSWVGECHELNAAYAADGYARIKGVGAVLTTFGVGELNAMNAFAGAYAEHIPIVHLVGMPSTEIQRSNLKIHHSLGDGDYQVFYDMYDKITTARTIVDAHHIQYEMDRLIHALLSEKRPIYIGIPDDLVNKKIEVKPSLFVVKPNVTPPELVTTLVERITQKINEAKNPIILCDVLPMRFNMVELVKLFIQKSNLPFAVLDLAKGIVDETHENYLGQYRGEMTEPTLKDYIESSDCVIWFGAFLTDFNTGGFSVNINPDKIIDIQYNTAMISMGGYDNAYPEDYLELIIEKLEKKLYPLPKLTHESKDYNPSNQLIVQKAFWAAVETFLEEDSVVISDFGTAMFGSLSMRFPKGTTYITQLLWGSIGYGLGSLLGASLASKKECVLFIGDGAFQVTAQSLSTLIKENCSPIVFLLNNEGYTVERALHETTGEYNEINNWRYAELPKLFGQGVWSVKVTTSQALGEALACARNEDSKLRFIEVVFDKDDMPEMLKKVGDISKRKRRDI